MAITFSSQTALRGYISPNVDPATDVMVFMSYALTDWCGKIGSNHAVVVTGHEQWEQLPANRLNYTSSISCQLLLRGDGYRSGESPWNPNMLRIDASNRNASMSISSGIAGTYDSADPDDWTQWERVGDSQSFMVNTNNRGLRSSGYVYPNGGVDQEDQVGWALYSDTPGKEWFYFNNPWTDGTSGASFLIRKFTPLSNAPTGERDLGWVVVWPNSARGYRAIWNYTYGSAGDVWDNSYEKNWMTSGGPGYSSISTVAAMQHTLPIANSAGALLGYMDDELIASSNRLKSPYNYRIGSAGTYTALGDYLLMKTQS